MSAFLSWLAYSAYVYSEINVGPISKKFRVMNEPIRQGLRIFSQSLSGTIRA